MLLTKTFFLVLSTKISCLLLKAKYQTQIVKDPYTIGTQIKARLFWGEDTKIFRHVGAGLSDHSKHFGTLDYALDYCILVHYTT